MKPILTNPEGENYISSLAYKATPRAIRREKSNFESIWGEKVIDTLIQYGIIKEDSRGALYKYFMFKKAREVIAILELSGIISPTTEHCRMFLQLNLSEYEEADCEVCCPNCGRPMKMVYSCIKHSPDEYGYIDPGNYSGYEEWYCEHCCEKMFID